VGVAIGSSEDAAKARVSRALKKLQKFFSKQGVDSTTATIAGAISAHSIQTAPAILAKAVTAVALAPGVTASGSTLTLVKATLIAMKTKTVVATIATAVVILGIGGYFVGSSFFFRSAPSAPAIPSDTVPIKLANDSLKNVPSNDTNNFLFEMDTNTQRTADSGPAVHLKCLVAPTSTGSADFVKSLTNIVAKGLAASSFVRYHAGTNSSLLGKRIRITGWI